MNDFEDFLGQMEAEDIAGFYCPSIHMAPDIAGAAEVDPTLPSIPPLTIGTTGVAQVSCAMSRDFVVYGETQADAIIRQSLENSDQCAFVVNHFFPTRPFNDFEVSNGALKVFNEPNAGGNSVNSEAMSFEVMYRLYGARLVKTEMAIEYWHPNWKKTDYLMRLHGRRVGVSVTRAMKFRGVFTTEDARALLYKKLTGVNISTVGVVREDRWEKQILHVWTEHDYIAITLFREYMELPAALRSNTVVVVTVSKDAPWLFSNSNERPKTCDSCDDLMTIG